MKITTLIENKSEENEELQSEHGLSVHIEVDGKNILFDLGQSGNFIDNAKALNVDLKKLDYVIISHGHYDHSGGLERLVEEVNPEIKLYLGNGFFNKKYRLSWGDEYEYIGNPFDEDFLRSNNIEFEYIKEDITQITENLSIYTNFIRDDEFENTSQDMYLKEDGEYIRDLFLDEISIGIKSDEGLVVLVGCSHVGIVNILETIIRRTNMDIYALIGGTHLVKEDDEKINKIIEYLQEKDIKIIAACHCTGKQGETMMGQQLEENFINNNTGAVLEV